MKKILTWHRDNFQEGDFRDGLILALVHSGVCATVQSPDGSYLFVANMHHPWDFTGDQEPDDLKIFGPDLGKQLGLLKEQALLSATVHKTEVSFSDDRVFEFTIDPVKNASGELQLLTTIVDLSDERQREQVLRGLLRELSHRSKNLLSIVLSLASQTARGEISIDRFMRNFRGRVFSLSASQDIVTDMRWEGARTRALFKSQVRKSIPDYTDAVSFVGDDPLLSPNAAMHVGLAAHELVTSMAARTTGTEVTPHAQVNCEVREDGQIDISWVEDAIDNAPKGDLRLSDEFSEALLNRVVPTSLAGESRLEFNDGKVSYRLSFPQGADT